MLLAQWPAIFVIIDSLKLLNPAIFISRLYPVWNKNISLSISFIFASPKRRIKSSLKTEAKLRVANTSENTTKSSSRVLKSAIKKLKISLELVKTRRRLGFEPTNYCDLEIITLTHYHSATNKGESRCYEIFNATDRVYSKKAHKWTLSMKKISFACQV